LPTLRVRAGTTSRAGIDEQPPLTSPVCRSIDGAEIVCPVTMLEKDVATSSRRTQEVVTVGSRRESLLES
jgi:hypothetical protein